MNEYDDHIEPHHILQDAMDLINKSEKVSNMIISIGVKNDGEEYVHNFTSGTNYANIGLCEQLKDSLIIDYRDKELK